MEPPWETEALRRCGARVLELLADFVEESRRGEVPVVKLAASSFDPRQRLDEEGLVALLRRFLDGSTRLHHPRYIGHQVAVPHFASALADLVSGVLNNGMSIYEMGPAATAVEHAVVGWMLGHAGWKEGGGGVLTHGGSLANLTALLSARAKAAPDAWERGIPNDLCILAPASAHYSIARAASIMGLGQRALVPLAVDGHGRVDPERLEEAYEEAVGTGQRVIAVCANACCTPSGLYDPLPEIADFCEEHELWLHVDGAHGAAALLSPANRDKLAGLERADSLVWDAHKMLQTSALCAAVLVRDRQALLSTFQQEASYIVDRDSVDLLKLQVECTKSPLGLKLFLVLAMLGEEGLARGVETLYERAARFHDVVAARPGFTCLCRPESNILCFRVDGPDELQTSLRLALLCEGSFHVTQADVGGLRWLRLTVMNPLTDEAVLEALLRRIEELRSS